MRLLLWYISIMLLCRYPPRQCPMKETPKGWHCELCGKRFLYSRRYSWPIPCTHDYRYLLMWRKF